MESADNNGEKEEVSWNTFEKLEFYQKNWKTITGSFFWNYKIEFLKESRTRQF